MVDFSRHDPLDGSAAVATLSSRVGTAGCFVTGSSDKVYLLGSAHVLAAIPSETAVFQPPGTEDSFQVAVLWDFYAPDPRNSSNVLDAALAQISQGVEFDPRIGDLAPPQGFSQNIQPNQRVWICGAGTGHRSSGQIQLLNDAQTVTYDDGSQSSFEGLVRCDCYGVAGDSGAAVLDVNGYVVGVHLCGTDQYSWFCPISMVQARWPSIRLVTKAGVGG